MDLIVHLLFVRNFDRKFGPLDRRRQSNGHYLTNKSFSDFSLNSSVAPGRGNRTQKISSLRRRCQYAVQKTADDFDES